MSRQVLKYQVGDTSLLAASGFSLAQADKPFLDLSLTSQHGRKENLFTSDKNMQENLAGWALDWTLV